MLRFHRLSCLFLASMLAGCVPPVFEVDHRRFGSSAEALQYWEDKMNSYLVKVTTRKDRIGGRALVAIPSRARLERDGFARRGKVSESAITYLTDAAEMGTRFYVDAIAKRRIFDVIDTVQNDEPEKTPFDGYDYLVYLYLPGGGESQWYVAGRGWEEAEILPFDHGKPQGGPRTNAWLDYLEDRVLEDYESSFVEPRLGLPSHSSHRNRLHAGSVRRLQFHLVFSMRLLPGSSAAASRTE